MRELKDGGQAFPSTKPPSSSVILGMTLRDYFAVNAPTGEVTEIMYKTLSRNAQEKLVGRKYPTRPSHDSRNSGAELAYQLEELAFLCEVNAAIRFMLADAMLAARSKETAHG